MSSRQAQSDPVKPRKLLFVITDLDMGGAEKCCVQLAEGLDRSCWSPAVCCLSPPGVLADRLRAAAIPVHTLDATTALDAPATVLRAARLMRRVRPTLVHTFLFHANIVGRLAARLAGVPRLLSSIRVAERRFRYHLVLENLTCRLSHKVVCVSKAVAQFTRRCSNVPASRLVIVPNGIDVDAALNVTVPSRSALGLSDDAIVAVYVGRLDPQKGVDVLLHAFSIACAKILNLHLLVVGSGPDQSPLMALAKRLGIESQCHFLGWRDDVPALLRTAELFVMPSRWEGMPNALLEAMAAGLPVIATRVEGTTELVIDGHTGRLVAVEDSNDLAKSLVELAANSELRQRWGQRGQEVARQDFSLGQMVAGYETLYDSLFT